MKIQKTKSKYTFKEIKDIFLSNQEELNKDFNNCFTEPEINKISQWVKENILWALIASKDPYRSHYDFVLDEALLDFMLKSKSPFFSQVNIKMLSENYKKGFGAKVDSDYDTYEYSLKEKIGIRDNVVFHMIPTLPSFLAFSNKLEEMFNLPSDSYKSRALYNLYEEYEDLIGKYSQNMSIEYQYGGNTLIDIQLSSKDLIGFYYGGYGDAGALYISGLDDGIFSWVDMH